MPHHAWATSGAPRARATGGQGIHPVALTTTYSFFLGGAELKLQLQSWEKGWGVIMSGCGGRKQTEGKGPYKSGRHDGRALLITRPGSPSPEAAQVDPEGKVLVSQPL